MKIVIAIVATIFGWVVIMIGNDVFAHDQTFSEAWKGSPHQLIQSLSTLAGMAWQYWAVSLIALGILSAVLLVRFVPDIRNQAQRR